MSQVVDTSPHARNVPLRPPDSEHYESCGVEEGLCNSLHAHAKAIVGEVTRIYEVELNTTGPMNIFNTIKRLATYLMVRDDLTLPCASATHVCYSVAVVRETGGLWTERETLEGERAWEQSPDQPVTYAAGRASY